MNITQKKAQLSLNHCFDKKLVTFISVVKQWSLLPSLSTNILLSQSETVSPRPTTSFRQNKATLSPIITVASFWKISVHINRFSERTWETEHGNSLCQYYKFSFIPGSTDIIPLWRHRTQLVVQPSCITSSETIKRTATVRVVTGVITIRLHFHFQILCAWASRVDVNFNTIHFSSTYVRQKADSLSA